MTTIPISGPPIAGVNDHLTTYSAVAFTTPSGPCDSYGFVPLPIRVSFTLPDGRDAIVLATDGAWWFGEEVEAGPRALLDFTACFGQCLPAESKIVIRAPTWPPPGMPPEGDAYFRFSDGQGEVLRITGAGECIAGATTADRAVSYGTGGT